MDFKIVETKKVNFLQVDFTFSFYNLKNLFFMEL